MGKVHPGNHASMMQSVGSPHVLLLFLDGVGLGTDDPNVNPLAGGRLPLLRALFTGQEDSGAAQIFHNSLLSRFPLDATLGIGGLPQSGTGQTALFTGINAAEVLGRHFGPYPHSSLRPLIAERNLLKRLRTAGRTVHFANAFPERFFEYVKTRRAHMTVTTLASTESGVPLLREMDLRDGRAVSADITNIGWHGLGYPDMPVIAHREAGRRLARLSSEIDFVLFEYWRPDHAGHAQDMTQAMDVLTALEGMLAGLLTHLNLEQTLLVVTSDHGNVEDLGVKTHTRNPVPLILYGAGHRRFAEMITTRHPDLTAVTPAILGYMTNS